MTAPSTAYHDLYREHAAFLRGYGYRLTGNVSDAEDLVHDTFVRALERPPEDLVRPWRPWLVRVLTNLARDRWRRARKGYDGPYLPTPVETAEADAAWVFEGIAEDAGARHDRREGATLAFLAALEVLTPRQRAVLVLRDVYDLSVRETAEALGLGEANIKVTLHRARKALSRGTPSGGLPSAAPARVEEALGRLLSALAARDPAAIEAALAPEVRVVGDGGGRYYAARKPVRGRATVAGFLGRIQPPSDEPGVRVSVREINGLPALVGERPGAPRGWAPRFVFAVATDEDGAIVEIHSILAPEKLRWVRFSEVSESGRSRPSHRRS